MIFIAPKKKRIANWFRPGYKLSVDESERKLPDKSYIKVFTVFHSHCNLVNPGSGIIYISVENRGSVKLSDSILSAVSPRAHDQHKCLKVDHSAEMLDIFLF